MVVNYESLYFRATWPIRDSCPRPCTISLPNTRKKKREPCVFHLPYVLCGWSLTPATVATYTILDYLLGSLCSFLSIHLQLIYHMHAVSHIDYDHQKELTEGLYNVVNL